MTDIEMHAAEGSEPAACSGQRACNTFAGVGANERAARVETRTAEGLEPAVRPARRQTPPYVAASPHPLAGEGSLAAGSEHVSSLKLAPAVSDGRRGAFQRGKPWADDLPRLKALIAEGKRYAECAEILGRSRTSVEDAVERYGLARPKKWTADEMRILLDRRLQAHTIPDIAAQLGRPWRGVEAKWNALARRLPPQIVARVRDQVRHNVGRKAGASC